MRLSKQSFIIVVIAISILTVHLAVVNVYAQVVKSNCVDTAIGSAPAGAVLPPECQQAGDGGLGIGPGGFIFPLKSTQSVIKKGAGGAVWCSTNTSNCHHHYNAADIFAPTGTKVVAAVSGKITQAHSTKSVGHTVHILGADNNIYYHAHMNSITVSVGQNVKAGEDIGTVGTRADAQNTPQHLHFDVMPNSSTFNGLRPGCSDGACQKYPLINVQPKLIEAFKALPE